MVSQRNSCGHGGRCLWIAKGILVDKSWPIIHSNKHFSHIRIHIGYIFPPNFRKLWQTMCSHTLTSFKDFTQCISLKYKLEETKDNGG